MRQIATVLVLVALGVSSGCAPAEVGGDYTVNLTNGENGCNFDNWTVGDTTTGVPLVVTQNEDQVQLDANGTGGVALDVVLGSSIWNGQVAGNNVTAALIGSRSANMGGCTYTVTVDLDASVDGDVIEGQLIWRPVTNMHADCGVLEGCQTLQTFNGLRPPTP